MRPATRCVTAFSVDVVKIANALENKRFPVRLSYVHSRWRVPLSTKNYTLGTKRTRQVTTRRLRGAMLPTEVELTETTRFKHSPEKATGVQEERLLSCANLEVHGGLSPADASKDAQTALSLRSRRSSVPPRTRTVDDKSQGVLPEGTTSSLEVTLVPSWAPEISHVGPEISRVANEEGYRGSTKDAKKVDGAGSITLFDRAANTVHPAAGNLQRLTHTTASFYGSPATRPPAAASTSKDKDNYMATAGSKNVTGKQTAAGAKAPSVGDPEQATDSSKSGWRVRSLGVAGALAAVACGTVAKEQNIWTTARPIPHDDIIIENAAHVKDQVDGKRRCRPTIVGLGKEESLSRNPPSCSVEDNDLETKPDEALSDVVNTNATRMASPKKNPAVLEDGKIYISDRSDIDIDRLGCPTSARDTKLDCSSNEAARLPLHLPPPPSRSVANQVDEIADRLSTLFVQPIAPDEDVDRTL